MDYSPPGSSVRGILQARTLEWVAISFSRGSFHSGIEPVSLMSPAMGGRFFITGVTWEAPFVCVCVCVCVYIYIYIAALYGKKLYI